MDSATREFVRQRADNSCEYCGVKEGRRARLRFHVEHIIARQHGGGDDVENLALACHLCNAHKGPNLTGIDPNSGEITPLFHPRRNRWEEHFANVAGEMMGLTAIGRVTVVVLAMNLPARIDART